MRQLTFCAAFLLTATAAALGQTAVGTAFTYQGRLEHNGLPVDDPAPVALTFRLFDAQDGNQVGSDEVVEAVVREGLFTVKVDFGAEPFATEGARWLEVCVEGQCLQPRQELTPTPFSLATRGITVDPGGNVGIGGADPWAQLTVRGDDSASQVYREDPVLLLSKTSGTRVAGEGASLGFNSGGSFLYGAIKGAATNSDAGQHGGYLSFFSTGAGSYHQERMRISENGYVGIGTTTPSDTLHVMGHITVESPSPNITLRSTSGGHQFEWYGDFGGPGSGNLRVYDRTTNSVPFFVSPTGDVGIGTTGPGAKLDVGGDGVSPALRLTAFDNQLLFVRSGASTAGGLVFNTALGYPAYVFQRRDSDGAFQANLVTIRSDNGAMGIGTTDPQAKLHVGGIPGIDGVRFPDGTLQTSAAATRARSAEFTTPVPVIGGPFNNVPVASFSFANVPAGDIYLSVVLTGLAAQGTWDANGNARIWMDLSPVGVACSTEQLRHQSQAPVMLTINEVIPGFSGGALNVSVRVSTNGGIYNVTFQPNVGQGNQIHGAKCRLICGL